jgi:DNA-binding MurR/RpiR family transcriptional regulator
LAIPPFNARIDDSKIRSFQNCPATARSLGKWQFRRGDSQDCGKVSKTPSKSALGQGPPTEFNELRDLIIEQRDKLPRRLAQVAAFAAEFPDEIAFGTTGSIAEQANVQPSALVRFAQAFGYRGFGDLQVVFQQRLRDRPSQYDARLNALNARSTGHPLSFALIDGFSSASLRSIEKFRERAKPEDLNEAANILARAETIYLIGFRRSYPIASYMQYTLATLGVRTILAGSPSAVDREVISFAGPRDAALAISFTPYASLSLELTRQIVAQKTPLVAITDSPFSPLALSTNIWFEVAENDFEGFRTLAATVTLAAALSVAVAEKRRAVEKPAI